MTTSTPSDRANYEESMRRWVEYYRRTEEHDRAVCRMRNGQGDAVPTTGDEFDACTRFAFKVRRELELDRWPQARAEASRLSFKGLALRGRTPGDTR
jgi:hypothetical protein